MVTLRASVLFEAVMVAVALFGAVHTRSLDRAATVQQLMPAPEQSPRLADQVGDLLKGQEPEARRLRVFVKSAARCVRGDDGVCRQMGELLLRQQALEREGRKPQVAAFLKKVQEARASGMSEAQVRSMVREGLAHGELTLSADAESQAVRRQLDELNQRLGGGERFEVSGSSEPMQVSAR